MVEVSDALGKSVKKRQKVAELSKSPKNHKSLKNLQRPSVRKKITEAPILRQLKTKNSSFRYSFLTGFQALFAGPRSSLDIFFELSTNKAKRVELLMLYYVFPQRSPEDL